MSRDEKYETGLTGEAQAERYLTETRGMRCLDRRYRAESGEIDLVMDDHGTVTFVEVKARPRGIAGDGLLAVTPDKQHRLKSAALHYLVTNSLTEAPVRFDVVEITRSGLRHVPNAF